MSRADRFYLFITVFLIVAVIAGGVIIEINRTQSPPIEIALSQALPYWQGGEICVDGAVSNPGFYPLKESDTVQALLLDAGIENTADLSRMEIYVPRQGEKQCPQKVDINRAETWLFVALPGIGEVLAQRIVDYRSETAPSSELRICCRSKASVKGHLQR